MHAAWLWLRGPSCSNMHACPPSLSPLVGAPSAAPPGPWPPGPAAGRPRDDPIGRPSPSCAALSTVSRDSSVACGPASKAPATAQQLAEPTATQPQTNLPFAHPVSGIHVSTALQQQPHLEGEGEWGGHQGSGASPRCAAEACHCSMQSQACPEHIPNTVPGSPWLASPTPPGP